MRWNRDPALVAFWSLDFRFATHPGSPVTTGMEVREALVALNMVEHVGPVRLRHLLNHFGDAPTILRTSADRLVQVSGVGPEAAQAIAGWERSVDLAAEMRRIEQSGVRILVGDDEEYPPLLREIYDPPIVLYVKGQLLPRDRQGVALVGSRQTTTYGSEVARRFGYQLGYLGITVVSGGARGIDTSAHQGALRAGGRTLAVLGTGINQVFPPENAALFEQIVAQGALLTQFPFNRPPDKQSFPIRNRIVAGMTLGTVVVEASLASGALITARFAADYGRQVFAVPGRIDSPRSKGCHDLIRQGARLCESPEDILSEFEYLFPPTQKAPSAAVTGALPALELPPQEQQLLELVGGEPRPIDELIRESGLSAAAVSVALLSLEMKRLVTQQPGKRFVRAQGRE